MWLAGLPLVASACSGTSGSTTSSSTTIAAVPSPRSTTTELPATTTTTSAPTTTTTIGLREVDAEASGWLWEGLATYSESLFAEHEGRDAAITASVLSTSVPEVTRPLDRVDSIEDLLDNATYRRGALLYHALRLEIGDEAFFMTLREFIQRNLHATAEVEDLQAIAEETSGEDLSRFFAAWVTETVVPDLPRTDG